MSYSLQQIFRDSFDQFASTVGLSKDMWHAAFCLRHCRTAELGGHLVSCPNGHQHKIVYNSCRHRACPQCALVAREQWLSGWSSRLLDCPHFHVIFTTPHQLNDLWRYNRKRFADALFAAATGALKKLLADSKYLGGRAGMLAALHTWSQTLATHVHLHVLVTAGGLDEQDQWVKAKKTCLLPRKVLMIIFRAKLRDELMSALNAGELTLPPDQSPAKIRSLLNKMGREVWNVKILDRYEHGLGVITYLARYLKGGPISPSRFLSVTAQCVRFRCRGNARDGEGSGGQCRLSVFEFFVRLLNHVPPRAMQAVRGYGLYAAGQRRRLNFARLQLSQSLLPDKPPRRLNWQDVCERLGKPDATKCPSCSASLVIHGYFDRGRPPPAALTLTGVADCI